MAVNVQRLPLVVSPENRDNTTNKDARLINCYVEIGEDRTPHLFRRPGRSTWGNPSGVSSAPGMGTYWWNGHVYSIFNTGTLGPPTIGTLTTNTTGGTLAIGTFFYVVTALNSVGETIASAEKSITTTTATSTITIPWGLVGGASSYKIYRGTASGGENVYFTATGTTPSFTDTGAAGTSGTPPSVSTALSASLYKDLTLVAGGLDNTGGVYSFNSIMGSDPKLVLNNGVATYAYDDIARLTGPLHQIDINAPQYTCKGVAYLDGYTFLLQHFFGTSITPAVIWGSVSNSVDVNGDWDPLNFITAQMSPDSGVYLGKQLVYVVCMKEWSTEFFYDAGNATGSPLAPAMNLRLSYGCASADSVQNITDVYYWLSNNREASNQIVMLENAQMRVISTPTIDRLLRDVDISLVYSWHIKIDGHTFYVITFKNNNLTLAYDINQNRWDQWTDVNGNYVPIVSSARNQAGVTVLQHETNGNLYYASTDYYTDASDIIPITIITPRWDGGTSKRKTISRMQFVSDILVGSLMSVQVSDDDYQTWSQPRIVDLGTVLPNLINCGTFRRRAWKFIVSDSVFWRLSAVDLQFLVGSI